MAHLEVKPKRSSNWWLWLVLVIIIIIAVAFIYQRQYGGLPATTTTTDSKRTVSDSTVSPAK